MNKEQTHTSLEFSKKLEEAGFKMESEYMWVIFKHGSPELLKMVDEFGRAYLDRKGFPAYDLLWDLSVRYRKEVWGEGIVEAEDVYSIPLDDLNSAILEGLKGMKIPKMKYHSEEVLSLLQQGKKQEAEDYFLKHSILFKTTK